MAIDKFGIKKIYATSTVNPQDLSLPIRISEINQEDMNRMLIMNNVALDPITKPGSPDTTGATFDVNGLRMIHPPTSPSNFVAMSVGGNPSGNGQRYNADHRYKNYMMIGYFKCATSQELIELKTDGPHHGSCSNLPKCCWTEPAFLVQSGDSRCYAEFPHPTSRNHGVVDFTAIPGNYLGKWIGYCVVAYQTGPYRTIEQWVDPSGLKADGKPNNNWILTFKVTDTGQITNSELAIRPVPPADGDVLEAEIRMHGANSLEHGDPGGTDFAFARVYEIIPNGDAGSGGGVTSDDIDYFQFQNNTLISWLWTTTGGYPAQVNCGINHTFVEQQGYTFANTDWKNIEFTGYFFVESVNDINFSLNFQSRFSGLPATSGLCCATTGYGLNLFWTNVAADKGKFALYKQQQNNSSSHFAAELQNVVPDFYQRWIGVKFVVYNQTVNGVKQVVVETYISPSDSEADKQNWQLIKKVVDYAGAGWGVQGLSCNGATADNPIFFGGPFFAINWSFANKIRFKWLSLREIDPAADVGTGPDPPGPPAPTTIIKLLTLRREIINNAFCSCDGTNTGGGSNPPGGGSGGGGGSSSLTEFYFVDIDDADLDTDRWKVASVTDSTDFKLKVGLEVKNTLSPLYNKKNKRIEVFIAEKGKPRGGTGNGVHVVQRKGSDNTIAVDYGYIAEEDIHDAGGTYTLENLGTTYVTAVGDRFLFEYDGGDSGDYVKVFRIDDTTTAMHKAVTQDNTQAANAYTTVNFLPCMRILGST